jgi:GxxExxY protein
LERQKPGASAQRLICATPIFSFDKALVVELKAVQTIHPIFPAKVIHYLKMSGLQLGLIINFHVVLLRDGIKRIVLSQK